MLSALKPLLNHHNIQLNDEQILEKFAEFESDQEKGEYRQYREIILAVMRRFGEEFGFAPSGVEQNSLPDSIKQWLPFSDTIEALKQLKQSLKLGIISNIDNALFAQADLVVPDLQTLAALSAN